MSPKLDRMMRRQCHQSSSMFSHQVHQNSSSEVNWTVENYDGVLLCTGFPKLRQFRVLRDQKTVITQSLLSNVMMWDIVQVCYSVRITRQRHPFQGGFLRSFGPKANHDEIVRALCHSIDVALRRTRRPNSSRCPHGVLLISY